MKDLRHAASKNRSNHIASTDATAQKSVSLIRKSKSVNTSDATKLQRPVMDVQ